MKQRTFGILLGTVIGLCALLTVAHAAYAVYAYQHCSIIYYIAGELW